MSFSAARKFVIPANPECPAGYSPYWVLVDDKSIPDLPAGIHRYFVKIGRKSVVIRDVMLLSRYSFSFRLWGLATHVADVHAAWGEVLTALRSGGETFVPPPPVKTRKRRRKVCLPSGPSGKRGKASSGKSKPRSRKTARSTSA